VQNRHSGVKPDISSSLGSYIRSKAFNFVSYMTLYLRITILIVLSCISSFALTGQNQTDLLLDQLDEVISNRDFYMEQKTERLSDLHKDLVSAQDDRSKFDALNALFTEYHSFNADSAYSTAQRQLLLAQKMGERNLVINALLNKINILNLAGMYLESMTLVDSIHYDELPEYLRAYYFHTKRSLYGKLADFSSFGHEREYYEKLTDQYRDSLLSVNDPNSVFYALIKADQLNVHNRSKEAIALLEGYINNNKLDEHELAICAFTLSDSYDYVHDTENQKKQLLISSIADMKSAVREYVSLRKLALLLYKEGDLERAYKLLTIAVEDATKSNARQRIVELNDSYPMINGIYVETVRRQKRSLEKAIIVITAMAIVLIILIIYLRKQMKRLSESRRKIEEANIKLTDLNEQLIESNCKLNELNTQLTDTNERLNILNSQLVKSNTKLQEAYSEIAEISELKEVYICQYMDQSLEHIKMLDTYRKSIGKLISNGKVEDLKKLVKSTKIIDDKLKLFYEQFDKTFLNLFPTFVEDFNSLLLPEEVITPKKAGTLNT
uniref:DUF6377 domain-containing protein n=2 Tax=Bacteroidales TaxID=171549 RepID=UPI0026157251